MNDVISEPLGPWNPGIKSTIPRHLRPLTTIFRPENVYTSVERATELRDLTKLELSELVVFRPERLVLHELLIRVTVDLSVPDGKEYADLGVNFRAMTQTILSRYIEPNMAAISAKYEDMKLQISALIAAEFPPASSTPATAKTTWGRGFLSLLGFVPETKPKSSGHPSGGDTYLERAQHWDAKANASDDPIVRGALISLARIFGAFYACHGHSWGPVDLLCTVATDLACNEYGSEEIGHFIDPYFAEAVRSEGYALLPPQKHPTVMNTKGTSASGKSTLRPLQKELANRIGVQWQEFALISPDIWRKKLLDYSSLGENHRYGGMLSSEELSIIDHKLDRYMARKAEQGKMSHFLIDRFRFGSFEPHSEKGVTNLLTRFGHVIYFFFMITPPDAIVERAWKRGLAFGRYKAVDDLLGHCVEAYSGMPKLFLSWARQMTKHVHYEFLDNSVALGECPRTVAFGWNGGMIVMDVGCLLNIGRYCKINVDAASPEQLYSTASTQDMTPDRNTEFLVECVRNLHEVNFADRNSGRIYLRMVDGKPIWLDVDLARLAMADRETEAGINAVASNLFDPPSLVSEMPLYICDVLPPESSGIPDHGEFFDVSGCCGDIRSRQQSWQGASEFNDNLNQKV